MTIDVPLMTDIQNACQLDADEFCSRINRFSGTSNQPGDLSRKRQAEFLATAMISCAAQHQRPRWRSRTRDRCAGACRWRIAQESISVRVCAAALAASHANSDHGIRFAISRQRLATARQSGAIDSMARKLLT
ncbi:hypothetical protein [Bradyrhizobium mercantei]|uniref:hypothetical protein n=1 Tax=Bradyrhizobium mercantei TaxID=1904807 RepID=UPI0011789731|nr:hypothetical protein [Bradyrhizobium mercantei]